MGKNKNKNKFKLPFLGGGNDDPPPAATPPPHRPSPQEEAAARAKAENALLAAKVDQLHAEVSKAATAEDLEHLSGSPPAPEVNLAEALKKAQEAYELCGLRAERAEKEASQWLETEKARLRSLEDSLTSREGKLNSQQHEQRTREEVLKGQEREYEDRTRRLTEDEQRLKQREDETTLELRELNAREDQLLKQRKELDVRESNAEAGFVAQRRESLRVFEEEAEKARREAARERESIAQERAAWHTEHLQAQEKWSAELRRRQNEHDARLQQERADQDARLQREHADHLATLQHERQTHSTELEAEKKVLEQERDALEKARGELKSKLRQLEFDRQDVAEYKADLDRRVEKRAEEREHNLRHDLALRQARLEQLRAERDNLEEVLERRKEADRRFGHKTPEEVDEELKALRAERDQLKQTLASRPGAEATGRLLALEAEQERWEEARTRLLQENQALKHELARSNVVVTELEVLRDQKASLESSRELLHAALEELRKDVDERIRRSDGISPFPVLSDMDARPALRSPPNNLIQQVPDLAEFTLELQQRMAWDPETRKTLYYTVEDIRSFLGGLAMSQLHLLQGISGTGKTSLPLAFARAVGAGSSLVPVQAGWRDRQDLLGHFNAFERRYSESEFLQALYLAGCPRYRDTLFLIVLDEMNLSHPEQYFADLLSALELDVHRRKLDLMPGPVSPAPELLREGRTLPLPPNVWFIGTANHDETTKDFADKTYDRAHVMELPRSQKKFEIKEMRERGPIAFEALNKAFDRARQQHGPQADKAYRFLVEHLADPLGQRFHIGWGNRLERQMQSYVPVVMAAGGGLGEAVDHILTTKLLRKLRNQHDTRPEDLMKLRDTLVQVWPKLHDKTRPTHALTLLQKELNRLGVEDEEAA